MRRFAIFALFILLPMLMVHVKLPVQANTGVPQGPPFVRDQLLIRFQADAEVRDIAALYAKYGLVEKDNLAAGSADDGPKIRLVEVKRPEHRSDLAGLIWELEQEAHVGYSELNYLLSLALSPDDADLDKLWGLHNTGQTGGTPDADIDAPEAWDLTTGSAAMIVGVIDTGVDYSHDDLAPNMWSNPGEIPGNGIDDDGNGYIDDVHGVNVITGSGDPMDDHGHGTHVAGTIGAKGDNQIGVVGVNHTVRILACKFLNAQGGGNIAGAVKCFNYFNYMKDVLGHNVVVTNNSWGGVGFSQALMDAMAGLDQPGMAPILHAAAAGNSNNNNDASPQYPSGFDLENIIAVAATDHRDFYASFSSYGATRVDLAGPGVGILSTVPSGTCSMCTSSGYLSASGTSMATPHVAGAAALVWSAFPGLTADEVKQRLLSGADYVGDKGGNAAKPTLTNGRLNLFSSLEDDTTPPATVANLMASGSTLSSVTLDWTATGDDAGAGVAGSYDLRYSTWLPFQWDSATRVAGVPGPQAGGSSESFAVLGLSPGKNYHFALKVKDNVGNESGLSNTAAAATKTGTAVYSDYMENGAAGWNATGLWNLDDYRSSSPSRAWYYGQPATRNYNTGGPNEGTITSQAINLSNTADAVLTFKEWSQVESNVRYDRTRVQASADGIQWDSVFESHGTGDGWASRTVDLTPYAGGDVYIRFWLNTIDKYLNDYEGWYVDDVAVQIEAKGPPPENNSPVADLQGPYSGVKSANITFDGSGSYDPDGDPLTYKWDFGDGTVSETGQSTVTHAYQSTGIYQVALVVNDGTVDSNPVLTTATVDNQAPVADIGGPYSGTAGATISFDGSGSYDPDGSSLNFTWDFGEGTAAPTSGPATEPTATHSYKSAGTYTVTLVVNDGKDDSDPAQSVVIVEAAPKGSSNDIYVWDIVFEAATASKGKKGKGGGGSSSTSGRALVYVYRDSDANGVADPPDELVKQAAVTVTVVGPGVDLTFTGTTSGGKRNKGVFKTAWIDNLSKGLYTVEVTGLSHSSYTWNQGLDPTANDTDLDADGLPDQEHTIC